MYVAEYFAYLSGISFNGRALVTSCIRHTCIMAWWHYIFIVAMSHHLGSNVRFYLETITNYTSYINDHYSQFMV